MNGIVNGYQTSLETIKDQVRSSEKKNLYSNKIIKTKKKSVTLFVALSLYLLVEVRPYSFIIPPPYLAVNNDDEKETNNNEWNIIDEKKNDTDDDDDDAAAKRIMLFIYIYLS